MRRCLGVAAALLAVVLAVAGCADTPTTSEASRATPTTSAPPPSAPHPVATAAAVARTVQDYLDEWAAHGLTRASRYLVASQRPGSDTGTPRLVSGRVTSYALTGQGPSTLTVEVSMRLRFDGSPLAWNRGENDRFVTAHRQGTDGSYLLEFATSP